MWDLKSYFHVLPIPVLFLCASTCFSAPFQQKCTVRWIRSGSIYVGHPKYIIKHWCRRSYHWLISQLETCEKCSRNQGKLEFQTRTASKVEVRKHQETVSSCFTRRACQVSSFIANLQSNNSVEYFSLEPAYVHPKTGLSFDYYIFSKTLPSGNP